MVFGKVCSVTIWLMIDITGAALSDPIRHVLQAALVAVDPGAAVRRCMQRKGDVLQIGSACYDLREIQKIFLLGIGKAAIPMGAAAAEILTDHLSAGLLITKYGHAAAENTNFPQHIHIWEAGHPIPDERSLSAGKLGLAFVEQAGENDLVICAISGGGSALFTVPAEEIFLDDLQQLTAQLLRCGATIQEINTLRKHLDRVKGGGLARAALPAHIVALALSDVVGDPLDVIASGPTVPDPTTYADAWQILEKYHLVESAPLAVVKYLRAGLSGDVPDTAKVDDPLFDRVQNFVIASNRLAAEAGAVQALQEGYQSYLLTTTLQGEASNQGQELAVFARQVASTGIPVNRPACIIAGGETTVTIQGNGLGGRNQELALGAVERLAKLEGVCMVTLATDGGDGPTDAAGAVVRGDSHQRALSLGLDPEEYLRRNDAYHFFKALGDLIYTGPTQTNVNDLIFIFMDA